LSKVDPWTDTTMSMKPLSPYRPASSSSVQVPATSMPVLAPTQQQHPLNRVHERLALLIPQMPLDVEGRVDAAYVRGALAVEGIDEQTLSIEGFTELLARCDVSPTGFLSFADFVLCLSRPHRKGPMCQTYDVSLRATRTASSPVPSPPGKSQQLAAANAAAASLSTRPREELSAEELAQMYARGARLHAGYLQPGLPRQEINSTEVPVTPEVLARAAGGKKTMPGPLSRPDGYRLDESGSYIGTLPGMEQRSSRPIDFYQEQLVGGRWVTTGGPSTSTGQEGTAAATMASDSTPGGGVAPSLQQSQAVASRDRRAMHVARGDAFVPSPSRAGPASGWRKFV
jgi:hypothetical protein